MDYAPDGDLARYSADDIADAVDWDGDADALIGALRDSGFLDGWALHDWDEYGGRLHRRREANAERMRKAREDHTNTTCTERAPHVRNTSAATGQDRTGQDRRGQDKEQAATGELVELARTIPGWKPSPNDASTIAAGVERMGEAKCRDVILKLKVEQSSSGKYRDLRRTLAAWLKTEKLEQAGAPPPRPPDDYSYGETPADIPEDIRAAYRRQGYDC